MFDQTLRQLFNAAIERWRSKSTWGRLFIELSVVAAIAAVVAGILEEDSRIIWSLAALVILIIALFELLPLPLFVVSTVVILMFVCGMALATLTRGSNTEMVFVTATRDASPAEGPDISGSSPLSPTPTTLAATYSPNPRLAPRFVGWKSEPPECRTGEQGFISVDFEDSNQAAICYSFLAERGLVSSGCLTTTIVAYVAPNQSGIDTVTVTADDGQSQTAVKLRIEVRP